MRLEKGAGGREQLTSWLTSKFLARGAGWVVLPVTKTRRCHREKSKFGGVRVQLVDEKASKVRQIQTHSWVREQKVDGAHSCELVFSAKS